MPDFTTLKQRRRRRIADRGVQPERTSLAWFRTLLSCCPLGLLILRHHWQETVLIIWLTATVVAVVAVIFWRYAHKRNLMDIASTDFSRRGSRQARLLIVSALFTLAMGLMLSHLHRLLVLLSH